MITLAVIAKHGAESYQALVNAGLPHVGQVVVAVDDGAEPGIEGYRPEAVEYYRRNLSNDFSGQRNFLIDHAKGDWILHLDTDENLTPWLWERLGTICDETVEDLIMLPRVNRYIEEIDKIVNWPDWQPKLHRNCGVRFNLPVHEWPIGFSRMRFLPKEEQYAIQHLKSRKAQHEANILYGRILCP